MIANSGPWSLGVLIGVPILVIVVLIALGFAVMLFSEGSTGEGAAAVLVALVIVGVALSPAGLYPYDSEYHQWRGVTGVVDQVGSRQISDGKTMSTRFVLVLDGKPFGVDDTRAAVVKPGDKVTLKCKREWQYAAESGWACRWGGAA